MTSMMKARAGLARASGATTELVLPGTFVSDERTARRVLEFFAAQIRNANTRKAYVRATKRFGAWCEGQGLALDEVTPVHAATYIEVAAAELTAPTVKQHLAALRMLCDWLVTGHVLEFNPFASVRGPKHVVRRGKTPVLFEDEARVLLDSIDTSHVVGLRDKAIIAVMTYSFARVGAVVTMKVKDYRNEGRQASIVLHEKGGQWHRVPVHHKAAGMLDAYLAEAGIAGEKDRPLFRSTRGRTRTLTDRGVDRGALLQMIKRRSKDAGLSSELCNHSLRATGITNYLANGGTLETAAAIAGHASTKTTQLYNRNDEEVSLAEIERIRI